MALFPAATFALPPLRSNPEIRSPQNYSTNATAAQIPICSFDSYKSPRVEQDLCYVPYPDSADASASDGLEAYLESLHSESSMEKRNKIPLEDVNLLHLDHTTATYCLNPPNGTASAAMSKADKLCSWLPIREVTIGPADPTNKAACKCIPYHLPNTKDTFVVCNCDHCKEQTFHSLRKDCQELSDRCFKNGWSGGYGRKYDVQNMQNWYYSLHVDGAFVRPALRPTCNVSNVFADEPTEDVKIQEVEELRQEDGLIRLILQQLACALNISTAEQC